MAALAFSLFVGLVIWPAWCLEGACPDGGCPVHSAGLVQRRAKVKQSEIVDDARVPREVSTVQSTAFVGSGHHRTSRFVSADDLYEGCKVQQAKAGPMLQEVKEDHSVNVSKMICSSSEILLRKFTTTGVTQTCCPESDSGCSGCALWKDGSCESCSGGYVQRAGACVACLDSAGWVAADGRTCQQLAAGECSNAKFHGLSSNEACCHCGGGVVSPTPFEYETTEFVIGEPVLMAPRPRTASRYGLDEDCGLTEFNLTMDGTTGEVSYAAGLDHPKEAFSVTCKVTAYQAPHVVFTTSVTVSVKELTYGAMPLVFTSAATVPLRKTAGHWSNLALNCAPHSTWLQLDAATGSLTATAGAAAGAVDNVEDMYEGQMGGVCELSGNWTADPAVPSHKKITKMVVVKPQPLTGLQYSATSMSTAVGEKIPAVELKQGSEEILMPSQFEMACDDPRFVFDSLLGIGLFEGHPIIQVASNGQIVLDVPQSFESIFDAMLGSSTTEAWKISFSCKVFGVFADPNLPTISAGLSMTIRDTTCWAQDTVLGVASPLEPMAGLAPADEAACRKLCRVRSSCAYYSWNQGNCSQVTKRADGGWLQATAKSWNCSNTDTCREVRSATWYHNGVYCPVGADTLRNSVIYYKASAGTVPQDQLVLYHHREAVDGAVDGCADGSWVLKKATADDYRKPQTGYFEMHGQVLSCPEVTEVRFATLPCAQPDNITEEEVKVQKIILDDPATPQAADFWLHPCECAPSAWGPDAPVDPVTFEMTADAETTTYVPPPLMLVSGEFVCPTRNLLDNPGIYFESETESMEYEVCEAKCKNHDDCNFFWHGTQSSATTCRLFSACDSLVREMGLEGDLMAMPRTPGCVVANPIECFTVSMRRKYLTTAAPETFRYWNLHAQCDMMLLLGGSGINACGRPTYRPHDYGDWAHKKKLPDSFEHGLTLKVSCWTERYSGIRGSLGMSSETLTCVNGNWFSSSDEPGIGSFNCFECVQVASNGFNRIEERREQELYFFNRMQLSIHSEVNQLGTGKIHCMEPKEAMPAAPVAAPQDWVVSKPLYERKPIEMLTQEFYHGHRDHGDCKSFDDWKKHAESLGGRLPTFEEAFAFIRENGIFYANHGIDSWVPTLEVDGTKDWIQFGNVPWAHPGKSHNSGWAWPGWADDASLIGWAGCGALYWKKITVIGATREIEVKKYKIINSGGNGGKDPRMTYDETKAYVEAKGGRLMTMHEARIWINANPKLFADHGIDMWVPVREADGTKDWVQAGKKPWANAGDSHVKSFGWPVWSEDVSQQGWQAHERLVLWVQKEPVTKSIWPGDVVALRNPTTRRFIRADVPNANFIGVSPQQEIPIPDWWVAERWVVVDRGYGDVSFHNPLTNAFLRIDAADRKMDQQRINFDAIPETHSWERFQIVEAGDGVVALWVSASRGFARTMSHANYMDASPEVSAILTWQWSGERFQVQHLEYASSEGLVSWFKSEDAAPSWRSAVGDYAGVVAGGEAKVYEAKGSGAAAPVKYLWGSAGDSRTTRTQYDFGRILKQQFTVCSVSRYLAVQHTGRVLQGKSFNTLHGHWAGYVGVVHYSHGWQTEHVRNHGSTNWVVVCASNTKDYVLVDGANVAKHPGTRRGGDDSLVINMGNLPNEVSDWAVMEVMTWNYGLSLEEMKNASQYLQQKVTAGKVDNCIYEVVNPAEVDRTYSSLGTWNADTSMLDNTVGGFCPSNAGFHGAEALDDFMVFDLKVAKPVVGVVIQGKYAHNGVQDWVWSFKVEYREAVGADWNAIDNVFTGVSLPDEKSRVFFTSPVKARYIKLTYFKFHNWACMRSAVIICNSVAANEMTLVESSSCSSTFRVEKRPDSDPESRHLVLASGAGAGHAERCVAYGLHEGKEIVIHKPCQPDDASQLIPARTMGLMYFNLHSSNKVSSMQRGLKAEFFYGLHRNTENCELPDFSLRQPDYVKLDAQLDYAHQEHWSGVTDKDYIGGRWTGFLNIKHAGSYTFFIQSDDSVELFLDGNLVIGEPTCGVHSLQATVDLQAGEIPFLLHWYEYIGWMMLKMEYQGPDSNDQRVLVPTSAFTHMADANSALMTDASHSRGCVGNTGLASTLGSIFAPNGQSTGVVCGFVPVVKADSPVVLPTSRQKSGTWPEWWTELQDMDIECSEGKVLMSIDSEWVDNKMRIAYTCGVVAGLGFCTPQWSDQRTSHHWNNDDQQILGKLRISCPAGSLLNKVKFEYSIGGRWARFKTSCCETGGVPVSVIRTGPDAARYDGMEGTYCPAGRLPSGRLEYHQRSFGPWHSIGTGHVLQFDRVSGTWCVSTQCSVPVSSDPNSPGYGDPVATVVGALDVGPVSDFDGNFEAKGVGGAAGKNGNKYLNGKLPKNPPKRPKPPKKPKLLEFKPEMPTYSDKCVEYGDLWKNIHETVVNDIGEEEAAVNKLETEEEEGAGYQDAHPCDIAGDAGGTSGKIGGGDGSDTRDQMPYDQLDGCHARDIERALVEGKESFWHSNFETTTDLAGDILGAVCDAIPIVAIEPFGAGVSIDSGDICGGITELVSHLSQVGASYRNHKFFYDMSLEDYADCNPLQTNFARLFCDIHCVRDAVIRGDRSIIRNLKQATDVTNKNLDQLSMWVVKSAQVDAGWLADKIDYAAAVNARDFESLKELMGADDGTQLVAIRKATEHMKNELAGLAQAASFGTASALTARSALQRFADQAKPLQGAPNTTQAMEALQALSTLKAKLQGAAQGRSKMDQLSKQLTDGIARAQGLARLNAQALGVYKHLQSTSKSLHAGHGSLRRAQHEVLTSLDKIWWSLRGKLDKYFDAADEEVQSFQRALTMMQDYQQCHSGYHDLLLTYKATMRTSGRTHRLLRNTWRECSNLIGELAATVADSDAFNTFMEKDGCASQLAAQTRNQARLAVSGMRLLWHRFKVAGLASPNTDVLGDAVRRMEDSYRDAIANMGCK